MNPDTSGSRSPKFDPRSCAPVCGYAAVESGKPKWCMTFWAGLLLVALPASASQISLAWNDNSTNETGFKIERSSDGGSFAQIATVGANVVTYIDANIPASTTYWYRVRATNGSGDSAYSNTITATAPADSNTAPVISSIGGQTINSGSSTGALSFTVSDAQTPLGSLVVTGSSSNTVLVPNSSIALGGSGGSRTVTVSSVSGQSGNATITVTVSDGTMTASTSFVVTVNAPQGAQPATQVFANQSAIVIPDASSNASLYPSPITVSGMSGPISTVSVQLINFSQNWTNDMDVLLVSPSGQKVLLMSDVGTGATANATFTFADSASGYLPESGSLATGSYKPTNYDTITDSLASPAPAGPFGALMSTFNGYDANGTWSLYVQDAGSGQGRRFDGGWSITITTIGSAAASPTIADIGSQSTPANTPIVALPFTVNDADTPASSLTLSGSSSNQSLVPNGNIVFGGSGSQRTVTITPAANQTGSTTITVTVSDGVRTATDAFAVTVNSVNTPPAISTIASQTITAGGNTGALAFTVEDAQTSAELLTVTGTSSNTLLVPATNIVFGSSGANRTVTVTPVSGQTGTANITVTVSDGALTSTKSFVLTVETLNFSPTNVRIQRQVADE